MGGVARTRALATRLKADLAIIDKRRPAPGKSQVMNIIGDVENKTCIIVDDIIDSGGTIVNAVDALKKKGAKEKGRQCVHTLNNFKEYNQLFRIIVEAENKDARFLYT